MTRCPSALRMLRGWPLVTAMAVVGPAWAGRPLAVDDANTNDRGAGHVEAWVERAGGATSVTLAPAYAPIDGLEFAAALSRDTTNQVNARALVVKWRITDSRERGCNVGASASVERISGGDAKVRAVNGLLTCNDAHAGSVHLNLGLAKASGAASVRTWGLAYERGIGAVTPHVEVFGEKGSRPTLQLGARSEVARGLQLDGTWGRNEGENLYSLGLKFQF